MENQSPYLFVYGTLMRGFNNPFATRLHANADFAGEGFFPGRLYRVSWYPGALYEPRSVMKVYGEIYELHDFKQLIAELDEYEDVKENQADSLYVRRMVPVSGTSGRILSCWTYLYNQALADAALLTNGKFTSEQF